MVGRHGVGCYSGLGVLGVLGLCQRKLGLRIVCYLCDC